MFTILSAVCDSRIAYRVLQRGGPFYMKRGCVCGMGGWDSVQWITWECYYLNGKRKCVTRLTDLLGTGPVFYPAVTETEKSHHTHSDGTEYICVHSQKATDLWVHRQGSRSHILSRPSSFPPCCRSCRLFSHLIWGGNLASHQDMIHSVCFSKCILPCSKHANWSTGGFAYESKSKSAKRSTEGTNGTHTPFLHILKHASMQASTESMQRKIHSDLGMKCCLFTSHMLSDNNILS